jgi:hypothetical protein
MKTVVFTGAGAAKADGAPLQTELFREFFDRAAGAASRQTLAREVSAFFEHVFSVDPKSARSLPTFEEALGVLDLAILREEGILGIGQREALGDLRHMRRQLILALVATIARDTVSAETEHARLVRSLRSAGLLADTTFVTTNYDTLLDDAIDAEALLERGTGSLVDYGLADLVEHAQEPHGESQRFPCYKIHGSLNWLLCPVCSLLDITYGSTGVTRLIDEPEAALCPACETLRTPIIVPPSYYKDISNVHLGLVWNRAFRALREADLVVFCGYSFPDADMHVKYLLKRSQLNRDSAIQPLMVALVNDHSGKGPSVASDELARFSRFLGEAQVLDGHLSFEEFARDPATLIKRAISR